MFWGTAKTGLSFVNSEYNPLNQTRIFLALNILIRFLPQYALSVDWESNHIAAGAQSLSVGIEYKF